MQAAALRGTAGDRPLKNIPTAVSRAGWQPARLDARLGEPMTGLQQQRAWRADVWRVCLSCRVAHLLLLATRLRKPV